MASSKKAAGATAGEEPLSEGEVFDLVLDYLNTKGYEETESMLRREHRATPPRQGNQASGSQLENMLEKSHVAAIFGGGDRKRVKRSHLDAKLADDTKDRSAVEAAKSLANQPQSMATQIASYNPCKKDPYGASSMPIYQVSTFAQPSATTFGEFDYSRSGNPTREAIEKQVAELEGGHRAFAFTSGMAALSAVTRLVRSGQEIVLNDDSYGGTYRLLSKVAARNNIQIRYVDMTGDAGPANLQAVMSENTALVMLESPTNPMGRVINIAEVCRVAHSKGAIVEVDSTMMSPVLQKPIDLGADLIVHSATKFISGHADCMAGIVVCKTHELSQEVYFYQNAEGTGLSPFDSWLLLRGIKTMHLRVEKQQANAMLVARFLAAHPSVTEVMYTGLESCPGHDMHKKQAKGSGSVLCFRTGNLAFSQHVVTVTKLFKITVSFGSVNSLISLPGAMSHASIPAEVRKARAFPEDLIRLSIGIESSDDLIADLGSAFQSFESPPPSAADTAAAGKGGGKGKGKAKAAAAAAAAGAAEARKEAAGASVDKPE